MRNSRSIAILLHEHDDGAEGMNFVIWWLRRIWQRRGLEVQVARGVRRPLDAGVVVLHVDLTVLPRKYARFAARHPAVLNGAVRDISKRKISANGVRSGDAWDGPVILKTDRNHGGLPERRLLRRSRVAAALRRRLGRRFSMDLNPRSYPIYPSLDAVPGPYLRNPAFFAERFLPEREGDLYCVRSFYFLGDSEFTIRKLCREPVARANSVVRREEVAVDERMAAARRRLGFDFGRFDYVMHAGEAVLLDANRTPGMSETRGCTQLTDLSAAMQRGLETLADGIRSWTGAEPAA